MYLYLCEVDSCWVFIYIKYTHANLNIYVEFYYIYRQNIFFYFLYLGYFDYFVELATNCMKSMH